MVNIFVFVVLNLQGRLSLNNQMLCAGVHEPHKGVSVKKEEWLIVRKGAGRAPLSTS
jgi:hypothetical protein